MVDHVDFNVLLRPNRYTYTSKYLIRMLGRNLEEIAKLSAARKFRVIRSLRASNRLHKKNCLSKRPFRGSAQVHLLLLIIAKRRFMFELVSLLMLHRSVF